VNLFCNGLADLLHSDLGLGLKRGIPTDPREESWGVKVLVPASATLVLLIGFVLDNFLSTSRSAQRDERLASQFAELMRVTFYSFIAALLLWLCSYCASDHKDRSYFGLRGFELQSSTRNALCCSSRFR